jgi:hypothetical protein
MGLTYSPLCRCGAEEETSAMFVSVWSCGHTDTFLPGVQFVPAGCHNSEPGSSLEHHQTKGRGFHDSESDYGTQRAFWGLKRPKRARTHHSFIHSFIHRVVYKVTNVSLRVMKAHLFTCIQESHGIDVILVSLVVEQALCYSQNYLQHSKPALQNHYSK